MNEWSDLLESVKNSPLSQLGLFGASMAAAWRLWTTTRASDKVEGANRGGQIAALDTWKQLVEGERAARKLAEERADRFAEERNKAMEQVYDMRGQLRAMNEQVLSQARELGELRLQLQSLQRQVDDRTG